MLTNDYEDENVNQEHNGEDNTSTESEGEEEEKVTLTKSELEAREREIRKEQDKRWKDRLKLGEEGTETKKQEPKEVTVDERYDRLELKTEGIKDRAQQDFVIEYAREKKITVSEALQKKVVQLELKEMAEATSQKEAVPSPSRRTGSTDRSNDVSYWARQLSEHGKTAPTAEMRRKVLNHLAGK